MTVVRLRVHADVWAGCACNLATASEKTVLAACTSRFRGDASVPYPPHVISAYLRVLPAAMMAIHGRQRLYFRKSGAYEPSSHFGKRVVGAPLVAPKHPVFGPHPPMLGCIPIRPGGNLHMGMEWWERFCKTMGTCFPGPLIQIHFTEGNWANARVQWDKPLVNAPGGESLAPPPVSDTVEGPLSTLLPAILHPDAADGSAVRTLAEAEGMRFAIRSDQAPVESGRDAHQIGPDLVKAEHFREDVRNACAAVKGRVLEKPCTGFKPGTAMKKKVRSAVDCFIGKIFTSKAMANWAAENPEFTDLVSKKWSKETTDRAIDTLLKQGVGTERKAWAMKVKDEVLPARGKAPRLILDCGPEGQLLSLVMVKCFEDILYDHFTSADGQAAHIKHSAKIEAVENVFRMMNGQTPENAYHNAKDYALYEGDGSAWDRTVSAELRHCTEDRILTHIANWLFDTYETSGGLGSWTIADLEDRAKCKRGVKYVKKDMFAKALLDAFRASGDRGTSCLNWFINFLVWTCIVCDKPENVVMEPFRKWYKQHDGTYVFYTFAFEGDDSIVRTNCRRSTEDIQKEWAKCGFQMKLEHRKSGQKVVFVGMCSSVDESGKIRPYPIPEPNRNVASASWSRAEFNSSSFALAFAARAAMFAAHPPLANYFRACGNYWVNVSGKGGKEKLHLDKDDQYKVYGDFDPDREAETFNDLASRRPSHWPDGFETMKFAKQHVAAYCGGGGLTTDQEGHLLSLTTVGPHDAEAVRGAFCPGMLC